MYVSRFAVYENIPTTHLPLSDALRDKLRKTHSTESYRTGKKAAWVLGDQNPALKTTVQPSKTYLAFEVINDHHAPKTACLGLTQIFLTMLFLILSVGNIDTC